MRCFAECVTVVERMRIVQTTGKKVYVKPNHTQEDNTKLNYDEIRGSMRNFIGFMWLRIVSNYGLLYDGVENVRSEVTDSGVV